MKIFAFFLKYIGKIVGAATEIFDKLEPEPKFLRSWNRSRTKMDRLRNTGHSCVSRAWLEYSYHISKKERGTS
jgi:hypothetical protein